MKGIVTMQNLFYLCGMTPEDCSGGIYGYTFDAQQPVQQFHLPFCGCNYLAYSNDRKTLYSTCIIDGCGGAAAFRIKSDGSLDFLNKLPSNGKSTCYVIAAPGGKYLYTANYSSSNISEFTLNPDGSLAELVRTVEFSGRGPLERQSEPHPHFTNFTPDGKKLIVIDLGLDAIKLFDFDPENGLTDVENPQVFKVTPAGSGPRHLVFNAAGTTAYLLNEIGNTVCVLDYRDGVFQHRQIINTLPADFNEYSKASAIRLSPDERFLFASNRGYDSTAVYRVLDDGALELAEIVLSGGISPRDVNFLPDGRHFAAANEFSDNTVFFDYDSSNGKLVKLDCDVIMPRPLAIYW